ncbi:MAG: cell shape determination protein CcmA [Bacteroidetes bacterium HGW-Bacteroidetes-12]|nr:MAG: cell shape determination protein CcmA [Bacteroidetes bacterium HGW-Bacteroidetes-12]
MKMAKTQESSSPEINIIQKGTEITGNIICAGDIRIDGTLKGSLISQGKLVVGVSGVIDGEIQCKNADVSGNINAKINVEELLQLKSTANIVGEINTNKLSIEPGANFSGTCNMGNGNNIKLNGVKKEAYQEAEAV